jgi:hypothetical protein
VRIVSEPTEQVRRLCGGREIDPIEAASIHIALQELRDRPSAYLEVEIAEDDSADRIMGNCRAIARELGLSLRFTITATRHVRDARGRPASEPAVLHVTMDRHDS